MGSDLFFLLVKAILIYLLVLWSHSLRHRVGLAPFYVCLGGLTAIMSWVTDAGVQVDFAGITFMVGSVVFYTSLLLGVFVLYVFDGPRPARAAIATVAGMSALTPLIAASLQFEGGSLDGIPMPGLRVNIASVLTTMIDMVFLGCAWEFLGHPFLKLKLWGRAFLTLLGVMILDVILFSTTAFAGTPEYLNIMQGTLVSRILITVIASLFLYLYLAREVRRCGTDLKTRPVLSILREMEDIRGELLSLREQRALRRRLAQTQELAQSTLDALPDRIAIVREDGRIVLANQPWITFAREAGYLDTYNPVGLDYFNTIEPISGMLDETSMNLFSQGLREVLAGEKNFYEQAYRFEGGTIHSDFVVRIVPLRSSDDRKAILVHTDQTEKKRVEEELIRSRNTAEEANRAKTRFVANMSHELRTPLNAVIGLSDLLMDSSLNEEQFDYLQTISTSGKALLSIVSDLLDLSKIEMDKMNIVKADFNVEEVVGNAISVLSAFAGQKGVKLTCVLHADVPATVKGDGGRVQQILVNLLNNAVKFIGQGDRIQVTVNASLTPTQSRYVDFAVQDNGIGMDAETIDRIFEPFQQGDSSNTREYGGVGLGLAICKELAEAMGGSISVESAPGEGSIFRFSIMDHTMPQMRDVQPEELRESWGGAQICIWDDDPGDLHRLEHLLAPCGIAVCYGDGASVEPDCLAGEDLPDALLFNLDMDGAVENFPMIRKLKGRVPVVGLSNWSRPLDESLLADFSMLLNRPVTAGQLYQVLAAISEKQTEPVRPGHPL